MDGCKWYGFFRDEEDSPLNFTFVDEYFSIIEVFLILSIVQILGVFCVAVALGKELLLKVGVLTHQVSTIGWEVNLL